MGRKHKSAEAKAAAATRAERDHLKAKAREYIQGRTMRQLMDPQKNEEAYQYLVANPLPSAIVYRAWMKARGELPPGFEQQSPQAQVAGVLQSLYELHADGALGAVLPWIVRDMREEPERFGKTREEMDHLFATAPAEVQEVAATMDRLGWSETLALRAADHDVEAGRTPRVLLEGEALAAEAAKVEADPDFQRRAAVERAWSAEQTKAEKYAPRFGDEVNGYYTDREYREDILQSLQAGRLSVDEAYGLWEQLDREAALRGELRPVVPRNEQEQMTARAYRAEQVIAALNAGQMPPPATEYEAQADGLTPVGYPAPQAAAGPRPFPLEAAHLAKYGVRMSRRDAAEMAYETLMREQTGRYSPELTGEPTAEDIAHDAEVAERIDTNRESLRDLVEAAAEVVGADSDVGQEGWTGFPDDERGSEPLRSTVERAFNYHNEE